MRGFEVVLAHRYPNSQALVILPGSDSDFVARHDFWASPFVYTTGCGTRCSHRLMKLEQAAAPAHRFASRDKLLPRGSEPLIRASMNAGLSYRMQNRSAGIYMLSCKKIKEVSNEKKSHLHPLFLFG